MAFKMRVLYYSKKGKMATLADTICAKYGCKSDDIPPAYPCENEKLVVLGLSIGKELPNDLGLFCRGFDKSRAKNVALYIDGEKDMANTVKNMMREGGVNVYDEVFYVKGGLPFKFFKKITDEEKNGILAWIDKIYTDVEKQ